MVDRIKAAVDARTDASFVIMARTDAHAVEGQAAALERAAAYVAAGADMIFAEALTTLAEYREFMRARAGAGARQHHRVRADAAVYARRSSAPPACGWCCIRCRRSAPPPRRRWWCTRRSARKGTQQGVVPYMQTRAELYDVLGYHAYEQKLDELFGKDQAMNEQRPAFKPKKSVALSGVDGRQHRAVHRRPHRQ